MALSRKPLLFIVVALVMACGSPASAGIVLDYSHDTFFAANATAKASLEAAAADIDWAITTTLNAISASDDTITGTNGGTSATFDWNWTYKNPSTGATETIDPVSIAANDVRVFVGMRNLTGTTLGQGGPGGIGWSISGSGDPSEWVGAMADAETKSNAVYGRGDGPVILNASGSVTLGSATASYDIDHGSTIGNLWFDSDTDNDGDFDTDSELAARWHFDHTTSVDSGKSDFFSVALHEILHAIGFGVSKSWDDLVSGTDWTGSEVIALVGTGKGLIDSGGAHVKSGTMSTRVSDGVAQEVVMDPDLTVGTRKKLTELDLAFLRDIGWSTIPEPTSWALMSFAIAIAAGYRARQRWGRQRWGRRKAERSAQSDV